MGSACIDALGVLWLRAGEPSLSPFLGRRMGCRGPVLSHFQAPLCPLCPLSHARDAHPALQCRAPEHTMDKAG